MKRANLRKDISCAMAMVILLSGCGQIPKETVTETVGSITVEAPAPATAAPKSTEPAPIPTAEVTPPPAVTAEKAEYLNYKFAYSISTEDLCDSFLKIVREECEKSFSRDAGNENVAQLCEDWVYTGATVSGYSTAAAFLVWSADNCGLIDAGTFIRSSSLQDVCNHLTDTNGFQISSLMEATQFGGNEYSVKDGDILIWRNEDGVAVNAGVVVLAQGSRVTVAICNSGGDVASFALDSVDKDTYVVKSCTLVNMTYTCNEQLVFLFLVNKMGYSIAAACGVMANIYCESLFEPDVEEHRFSEGYGLFQWTGQRRNDFELWCTTNGYDHRKLYRQLLYMQYELENNVCGDLDHLLRNRENTEQDAYKAGQLWCELYENPTGSNEISDARGAFARDSFYPAYKGHPYM